MKKLKIATMPIVGSALLILLYLCSLRYRGFMSVSEYDFAMMLKDIFPSLSGTFLPKLPAALATLTTGALLYLAAKKLRLLNPGGAAALYLCFPLVWYVGTSASAAPVMALSIALAATGLFIAHRDRNLWWKLGGFAAGLAGAVGAAFLAQTGFFTWTGVVLAFFPVIFLTIAVLLEKSDSRGTSDRKLKLAVIMTAVLILLMLGMLIAPSICRFLKISYPEVLTIFLPGERVYIPALALLIPLFWLYLAMTMPKSSSEKVNLLCTAVGLLLLILPPTLPWQRMTEVPQAETLKRLFTETACGQVVVFADDSTAAAAEYVLNIPVRRVGRDRNDLDPSQLSGEILNAIPNGDVAVFSDGGELDSFLPGNTDCIKFTSRKNCKLYLFKEVKK